MHNKFKFLFSLDQYFTNDYFYILNIVIKGVVDDGKQCFI